MTIDDIIAEGNRLWQEITPGPLQMVEAGTIDPSGKWHVYLATETERKIAALWGGQDEKVANAQFWILASNHWREVTAALEQARAALAEREREVERLTIALEESDVALFEATKK